MTISDDIVDEYELSPVQEGMLFHSLCSPNTGVYIQQIVVTLHDALDLDLFKQAWQLILDRHTVLRTSFLHADLDRPVQRVHRTASLEIVEHDWNACDEATAGIRLDRFLAADKAVDFELDKAPLMRMAILQLSPNDCHIVWTFHHALMDGRSFPIILQELFAIYDSLQQSEQLQLSDPQPYKLFIEFLRDQDQQKERVFWEKHLSGYKGDINLSAHNLRSAQAMGKVDPGRQEKVLPATLASAMESFAKRSNLTLSTLLQAAWALFLSRYCNRQDIVFGVTRACRRSAPQWAESMIGLFINTLPLRIQVRSDESALTLLRDLRASGIEMRDHEHTPLTKIYAWSGIPAERSLFDSIVVFENYSLNDLLQSQGGSWTKREFRSISYTNYALTLAAYARPRFLLQVLYDRRDFDDEAVVRILEFIQITLESLIQRSELSLAKLPELGIARPAATADRGDEGSPFGTHGNRGDPCEDSTVSAGAGRVAGQRAALLAERAKLSPEQRVLLEQRLSGSSERTSRSK